MTAESITVPVTISVDDYVYLADIAEGVNPNMTLSQYLSDAIRSIIGEMRMGL